MIDEEFIQKIFDKSYINPVYIHSIFPPYKISENNKFIFYAESQYSDELMSICFDTEKEAEEARQKLINIVHNKRCK